MSNIVPDPASRVTEPRRPSAAEEQLAEWQTIAATPASAYASRIGMARSVLLARFPESADRLAVERCLDGWYDA